LTGIIPKTVNIHGLESGLTTTHHATVFWSPVSFATLQTESAQAVYHLPYNQCDLANKGISKSATNECRPNASDKFLAVLSIFGTSKIFFLQIRLH